jgi:hypothetical protein
VCRVIRGYGTNMRKLAYEFMRTHRHEEAKYVTSRIS